MGSRQCVLFNSNLLSNLSNAMEVEVETGATAVDESQGSGSNVNMEDAPKEETLAETDDLKANGDSETLKEEGGTDDAGKDLASKKETEASNDDKEDANEHEERRQRDLSDLFGSSSSEGEDKKKKKKKKHRHKKGKKEKKHKKERRERTSDDEEETKETRGGTDEAGEEKYENNNREAMTIDDVVEPAEEEVEEKQYGEPEQFEIYHNKHLPPNAKVIECTHSPPTTIPVLTSQFLQLSSCSMSVYRTSYKLSRRLSILLPMRRSRYALLQFSSCSSLLSSPALKSEAFLLSLYQISISLLSPLSSLPPFPYLFHCLSINLVEYWWGGRWSAHRGTGDRHPMAVRTRPGWEHRGTLSSPPSSCLSLFFFSVTH